MYSFIVTINVDLKCLWIVLHNDDILCDMVLMMPRRSMTMLINI